MDWFLVAYGLGKIGLAMESRRGNADDGEDDEVQDDVDVRRR